MGQRDDIAALKQDFAIWLSQWILPLHGIQFRLQFGLGLAQTIHLCLEFIPAGGGVGLGFFGALQALDSGGEFFERLLLLSLDAFVATTNHSQTKQTNHSGKDLILHKNSFCWNHRIETKCPIVHEK